MRAAASFNEPDEEVAAVRPVPKAVTYCAFGLLTAVGLRDRVLRSLAFFPPQPPAYGLDADGNCYLTYWCACSSFGSGNGTNNAPGNNAPGNNAPGNARPLTANRGLSLDAETLPLQALEPANGSLKVSYEVVKMRGDKKTAVATPSILVRHTRRSGGGGGRPLIIYAHGNATDIGGMAPGYVALAERARVDVLGFEYQGYGLAGGHPSEQACCANVRAAYRFATETLNVKAERIIVLGQSLGSAAATDLATDPKFPVAGLILQSGVASAVRILHEDVDSTPFFDAFTNVAKLQKRSSAAFPVLVLHGRADDQVPCRHGQQLFAAAAANSRSRRPWAGCCWRSKERKKNRRRSRPQVRTDAFQLAPLLTVKPDGRQVIVPNNVYETEAMNGNANSNVVRFVLVEHAGHNNIEDVMGQAYYNLLRSFCHAAIARRPLSPARLGCVDGGDDRV